MKKIFSFLMSLVLVTGAMAMPVNPKKQAQQAPARAAKVVATHPTVSSNPTHATRIMPKADAIRKAPQAFNAATTTFTFASTADTLQTKSGISLRMSKAKGQSAPAWTSSSQMRVYANNTITVSGSNITRIELTFAKQGSKDYLTMTADKGSLVSGGTSTGSTDLKTDVWTGTETNKVTFTMGDKGQRIITQVVVTGEGGGGGESDTISVSAGFITAFYGEAELEEGGTDFFWDFAFTPADDAFPFIYFSCNNAAEAKNSIEGEWEIFWAMYVEAEGDTVYDDGISDGSLIIMKNELGGYDLYGTFIGENSKVYEFAAEGAEAVAYDVDNDYEEIDLGGSTGGDTITITGQNAIEFAQYLSYSEEGAYNYSVNLYNDEDIYPYLALDIFTPQLGAWTGSYVDSLGNIGEYCAFYPDEDSDGVEVSNLTFTISENLGMHTVAGEFDGSDNNHYIFSVSAVATLADGDYPYEPMEAQSAIQISGTSIEVDDEYVAYYGEAYYYLETEEGNTLTLTYITEDPSLYFPADGTYSIDTVSESFYPGYYMSFFGYPFFMGCVYETEEEVFYATSGTITISTAADSTVTLTVALVSAHGTSINGTFTFPYPVPQPEEWYTCQEAYNLGMELDEPAKGKSTDGEEIVVRGYVQYAYSASDYTQDAWLSDEKGAKSGTVKAYKCEIYDEVSVGDYVEVIGTLSRYKNKSGEDIIEVADGTMEIIEEPTAVENIPTTDIQATKVLRNGTLLIQKNGHFFTIMGQAVQ